jgi:D-glycerate 3-kinase
MLSQEILPAHSQLPAAALRQYTDFFPQLISTIFTMYPQPPAVNTPQLEEELARFLADEQLPGSYGEDARRYFLPLLDQLLTLQQEKGSCLLLGINGSQGSGKSTLAALLCRLLQVLGYSVANLSIDDFYLSRAARQELARQQHPLLASRGVPGTHDTALLRHKIKSLLEAQAGERISLPRFDKASDDCRPEQDWPEIPAPVNFIFLEGWFVGLQPQSEAELASPVNELEAEEDADGSWRRFVNRSLAGDYQQVFAQLDALIMLKAPSFEQVFEWRGLQETKLRQRSSSGATGIMNEARLRHFIQHFERLTRHCLDSLPARSDQVFALDTNHRIHSADS